MTEIPFKPLTNPPEQLGFVTKDGMWAAVPYVNKFIIIHNGEQVHMSNNLDTAKSFISKQLRKKPK